MLPLKHRLPLRFSRHYLEAEGKATQTPLFTLLVGPSMISPTSPTRIAFIVSKKIHPHAVKRNSLKRQFVAALLPLVSRLSPGFDLIFFFKKSLLATTNQQLADALKNTLARQNLISS